jgi:hypothetical protein
MIRITSYLHRDTLYDSIYRWMCDDVRSGDGWLITSLVAFNNAFVSRYLADFARKAIGNLYPGMPLVGRPVHIKGELKDAIVVRPPYTNPRIEEMLSQYHMHPERYYRETPFSAQLYFIPYSCGDVYVGSHRIKRVRRLAEKSARRIIDRIFANIRERANALADDRARRQGIPRESLVTEPEDMAREFEKAESKLVDDLRNRRRIHEDNELIINDVAGIKIISEDPDPKPLVSRLIQIQDCQVVEIEPHRGHYNATNVLVQLRPDKQRLLQQPLSGAFLRLMHSRGLDAEQANRAFAEFVQSGEDTVNIEVIISSYQEMLESEIGRCMHEDRIIHQRLRQEYRSYLAKNVEYLMEYLFALGISPQAEVRELPIKLWNRYLPDYFDDAVKRLFNIPPMNVVE